MPNPQLTAIEPQSAHMIKVTFNTPVGDSALNPDNYQLSGTGQGSLPDYPDFVERIDDTSFNLIWISAGIDKTISQNEFTQLDAIVPGTGPYIYSWTPADGLDDPTTKNPIATPTQTTEYALTVTREGVEQTESGAYIAVDSVTVNHTGLKKGTGFTSFAIEPDGINQPVIVIINPDKIEWTTDVPFSGIIPNGHRCRISSSGTLPSGINQATTNDDFNYFIRTFSATSFKLYSTIDNSINDVDPVQVADLGTGVHTLSLLGFNCRCMARCTSIPFDWMTGKRAEITVDAAHINEIECVEFSLEGGPWLAITSEKLNSKNEYGYTAVFDTNQYNQLDTIKIRWRVKPKISGLYRCSGKSDTLNQEEYGKSYLNKGEWEYQWVADPDANYSIPTIYVSSYGSNESGNGSYSKPYRTIRKAYPFLEDGNRVFIKDPGTYTFPNRYPIVNIKGSTTRWITIEGNPSVDKEDIIVISEPLLGLDYGSSCSLSSNGTSTTVVLNKSIDSSLNIYDVLHLVGRTDGYDSTDKFEIINISSDRTTVLVRPVLPSMTTQTHSWTIDRFMISIEPRINHTKFKHLSFDDRYYSNVTALGKAWIWMDDVYKTTSHPLGWLAKTGNSPDIRCYRFFVTNSKAYNVVYSLFSIDGTLLSINNEHQKVSADVGQHILYEYGTVISDCDGSLSGIHADMLQFFYPRENIIIRKRRTENCTLVQHFYTNSRTGVSENGSIVTPWLKDLAMIDVLYDNNISDNPITQIWDNPTNFLFQNVTNTQACNFRDNYLNNPNYIKLYFGTVMLRGCILSDLTVNGYTSPNIPPGLFLENCWIENSPTWTQLGPGSPFYDRTNRDYRPLAEIKNKVLKFSLYDSLGNERTETTAIGGIAHHLEYDSVNNAPNVSFTTDRTSGYIPFAVTVTDESSILDKDGDIISVDIDWGDGTIETNMVPGETYNHTYSVEGNHTLSFTSNDYSLSSTDTEEITANSSTIPLDQLISSNNPVSFFKLSETSGIVATDYGSESTNTNYMLNNGVSWTGGTLNQTGLIPSQPEIPCAHFSAQTNGSYLSLGNPSGLQITQDISILFIIKTISSSLGHIVAKDDTTNRCYTVFMNTFGKIQFYYWSNNSLKTLTSTTSINDNNPHIVIVRMSQSESKRTIEIDGTQDALSTSVSLIDNDTVDVRIGRPVSPNYPINAYLQYVTIFNTYLDDDKCEEYYQAWINYS